MKNCTPITNCIACGSSDLVATLDFGEQPLANNFRSTDSTVNEEKYPLAINRCQDCDHLQLTHAVDPKLIYTHYLYVSGTSGTYLEYMKWYARFVLETFTTYTNRMGPYSVLDIGCNDGSQLDAFKELLFKTHGVDPAENLYPTSSAKHNVVLGFWDSISANLLGQEFDVITTQNAFAHIPDPLSYLKLAKTYLKTDGKIFISTSQSDMVLNGEFDTIYHEHISYYNVESMKALAERAGLHLIDVVKTPIHGTSYVFVLSKQPHNRERIENSLAIEARLHSGETYRYWAAGTKHTLQRLRVTIDTYKDIGYRIVGYGAAAKGMTLLNASRIPLDVVVDDNSLKQGLWCPGTHVPVVGPEYIKNIDPMTKILFVPLAWNFYTEISRKILAIRNQPGDTFIRYFPELQIDTVGLNEHQH
jgi:2-polyprenyl-3-methyl-5-hydroxy-6-metoxy-1,4-benzoquinol methylase